MSDAPSSVDTDHASALHEHLRGQTEAMLDLLERLVRIESPTSDPQAQQKVQSVLADRLAALGFRIQTARGGTTADGDPVGNHLIAFPENRSSETPVQLLLGHGDTVWPHGTLESTVPFEIDREKGVVQGPGVFDMKAGLTQMIFALEALTHLGVDVPVQPIVMVSADEEIGSPTGTRHIERLAPCCDRALVVEPALGLDGKIKTERKGSGRFHIHVKGKSAHAGLDPESGSSAILELSHVVQRLHDLNDPKAGISVNVGTIGGGTRPNVVAAESTAEVDVRITTKEQAEAVEHAIRSIEPTVPETKMTIEGGISRLPMSQTPASRALWQHARTTAERIGLSLDSGRSGGVSDGNTAARFTPTLDGLGPVGDGAHARHEFCYIDAMAERSTILALLIASPATETLLEANRTAKIEMG
ncbi:carboxypeptidase [Longibacter salinarum]|uniref:Carboxypeptidase n=1 Tax=Longibacter salinarum TaxID=1850348 RepID=A0A2A8CX76_9BACT|nr:M20 family metallopeptidase [Longibacter salinarum]PEN13220.1 carboxypeptidase [Longibacter salinarum]